MAQKATAAKPAPAKTKPKAKATKPRTEPAPLRNIVIPRVGQYWPGQGGIYLGIMLSEDGKSDYHLILAEKHEANKATYDESMKFAAGVEVDGHKDFALPDRREARLCFINGKTFFRPEWYWTSEQHASYSLNAWVQGGSNGSQGCNYKDNEYRARVVRRLIIR